MSRKIQTERLCETRRRADFLLNPHLHEGRTSVVLEAMRWRLPIIARGVAGNEIRVVHGSFVRLFEFQEPHSPLSAIKNPMRKKILGIELGPNGRTPAKNGISWRIAARSDPKFLHDGAGPQSQSGLAPMGSHKAERSH